MSVIKSEVHTTVDSDGNTTVDTKETVYKKEREPDYVKLYTKMWCEFNQIPMTYQPLFIELIQRMSYCNSLDLKNSQIVYTGKPISDSIMKTLGWKRAMYQRGLAELTKADAIRKVSRGVYQINPNYAGRGSWRYNPQEKQGGIKDLIATFNFKDKTVDTKIVWSDDGTNSDLNELYREGLGVRKEDETVLSTMEIKSSDKLAM